MKTYNMVRISRGRMVSGVTGILLALILTISSSSSLLAIPQLPGRFQGRVTINGIPAPAGVRIEARMNGVSETFVATTDAQSNYALLYVKGDDPDTTLIEGAINGSTVQFFVGIGYAASSTFSHGASTTLNLNVVISGDSTADGQINALDITKFERIIAGLDAKNPGADANVDGMLNAQDISKIERLIVGLP